MHRHVTERPTSVAAATWRGGQKWHWVDIWTFWVEGPVQSLVGQLRPGRVRVDLAAYASVVHVLYICTDDQNE